MNNNFLLINLAALILFLLVFGNPATAKKEIIKRCKRSISARVDASKRSAGKKAAKASWSSFASDNYGNEYRDWTIAKDKKVKCKKYKNPNKPKLFCTAKAKPCSFVDRCVDEIIWGNGTGETKNQAKSNARIDWINQVESEFGQEYSSWGARDVIKVGGIFSSSYICEKNNNIFECTTINRPCLVE